MSIARRIADFVLAYALAQMIMIPLSAILHGEIIGVGLVIAVLVITAGVVGLMTQLEAIDETLRLTTCINPG